MAHYQQFKFIECVSKRMGDSVHDKGAILEIGSYGVNGTIRELFPQDNYIGVDLTEGPNVDVVGSGHEVDFKDSYFDLTISCEVFEHNPYWKETLENMYRMTKDNGYICITVASRGRLEHGTTRTDPNCSPGTTAVEWNYYKNLFKNELLDEMNKFELDNIYCEYNGVSKDLYFFAQKSSENKRRKLEIDDPELKEIFIKRDKRNLKGHVFEGVLFVFSYILDDIKYQNFALKLCKFRDALNGMVFNDKK